MSAPQHQALSAIAFQLAAALDNYEQDVHALVAASFDPELYRRISRQMDDMRMYAAALPQVSVAWVEVMIRHFELTHAMWRNSRAGEPAVELQPLLAHLREAVARLSRKCAQLMPSA
jgi:hypothetical protein